MADKTDPFSMASYQLDDNTYRNYRNVFLGWARKKWTGIKTAVLEDTFHEALVVLAKYQLAGKLTVAPTTFLIAVGNKILGKQPSFQEPEVGEQKAADEEEGNLEHREIVRRALKLLDDKCREILICKYFYGFRMAEISEEIGSKNAGTVRVQNHRCLDKLKREISKMMG